MVKEVPLEVKAVVILRDSLEKAVTELNELLQEQVPQEFREKPVIKPVRKTDEKEGGEGEITAVESAESVEEPTERVESAIPDFDPEDLMNHEWKGKKIGEGQYAEGSLSWGWDFRENFKPATIKALEADFVMTIDKNEFILLEKIVQTKKIKASERDATPSATRPETTSINQYFPKDLEDKLRFHDEGDWFKVSPKTFLGSENFSKIASIIRELGGEYVSAGKNSHFKVPKKEMK